MKFRKLGIKLVLFGVIGMFGMPYLPIDGYISTAIVTFLIGAGIFLIFFGGYDHID